MATIATIAEIKKSATEKMAKSQETLRDNLHKLRTGRVHVGLLDHIHVDYYGASMPLNQVANLTLLDARTLGVAPYEKKMVPVCDKAIRESDLGLNPSTMGDLIRVPMPALTEQRRKDLTKVVRSEGEDGKVAVRNLRREANDALKKMLKDKLVSEDEERRAQDEIQKLTDKNITEIDKAIAAKEAEIMQVGS